MSPTKVIETKKRAGELLVRMIYRYEGEVNGGRESMHQSHRKFGRKVWLQDYAYTVFAVANLRAARLLYDKLPRYAK